MQWIANGVLLVMRVSFTGLGNDVVARNSTAVRADDNSGFF